ncbi:MAG: AAA family ATPase, partial [Thalassolituus sp.]
AAVSDSSECSDATEFSQLHQQVISQWNALSGRTGALIRVLELSPPEVFVAMLAGLADTDPEVTFALADLQQPENTGQLSVHLALDLVHTLFANTGHSNGHWTGPWDVLNITHNTLTDANVLKVMGEGPLPLRSLQINLNLWAVLKNQSRPWPQTEYLRDHRRQLLPEQTRRDLPSLAARIQQGKEQQASVLIIRGQAMSGRHILATEITQLNGGIAVKTPLHIWQEQPEFRLACALAGWTPVIEVTPAPGESAQISAPYSGQHAIVITAPDAAINVPNSLQYLMPLPDEQQRFALWHAGLQQEELARQLAGNALLSGPVIDDLLTKAALITNRQAEHKHTAINADTIRQLRAQNSAAGLSQLAQPIHRTIPDNAVVFPPLINDYLRDLIHRAIHRETLWSQLGDSLNASQNPGLRALFVGDSGTGKTLAASYIASRLGAPLYRVDLGSVMNKYIGESEKNLGRLLDHAAATDAILLFDEADSVFGSRTDARSSGERFANNLTNYLLARIESHPGIVLLTTNHRDRIDPAFNRRLEIIIDFPQPGFNERLRLWESHLGPRSPGEDTLRSLASHCDLSGGQIRNAVLTAAANDTGTSSGTGKATTTGADTSAGQISARALFQAVGREYQKLGRALPAALQNSGS